MKAKYYDIPVGDKVIMVSIRQYEDKPGEYVIFCGDKKFPPVRTVKQGLDVLVSAVREELIKIIQDGEKARQLAKQLLSTKEGLKALGKYRYP